MDMGPLKPYGSIFCLQVIRNMSTYVVNMGSERVLPLEIYLISILQIKSNFFG